MATEQLRAAIHALYHGTSEQERAQANAWLMAFSGTAEAWGAASALLAEAEEEVQYFGANLLYMKVRKEWDELPEEGKRGIYTGVQQLLRRCAPEAGAGPAAWRLSPGARWLCLALAAAAAREKGAADRFVRDALQLAAEPSAGGGTAAVAIELLTAVPQEVGRYAERGG